MPHFVDQLLARIEQTGSPVCVGIDPVYERLPDELRRDDASHEMRVDAIFEFVTKVLQIVAPHVPIVKFQLACFERYGPDGLGVYHSLVQDARAMGLMTIGDAKRGDIGATAEHYAAAMLLEPGGGDEGDWAAADAVTVNSYFGRDGLSPFLDLAAHEGKGVFALVRTSNPGGDAIQSLKLADGRTVAEAVAALMDQIGGEPQYIGDRGYSVLGAVVGATKPGDAARLRELMPRQLFLVPGFGAQGGAADDVRACFRDDGTGAIITASRSITYAFEKVPLDWQSAIEAATLQMKREIAEILASG